MERTGGNCGTGCVEADEARISGTAFRDDTAVTAYKAREVSSLVRQSDRWGRSAVWVLLCGMRVKA
jgi:hypothetical protein